MSNNDTIAHELRWDIDVAQSEKEVSFFRNTIVRALLIANGVFVCASFGIIGYFIRPTESLLILHYNVYFGVEIQGVWWQTFMLPIVGMVFLFGHTLLARDFYQKCERIAAYLMLFGAALLNGGILIAGASIVFINY